VGSAFTWQSGVKSTRAWMGPFITIGNILAGKVSPFFILGLYDLIRSIHRLLRAQGVRGGALYLKACTMYLYKYVANERFLDQKAFGPVVGLTRSGIPLILPPMWRRSIKSGNLIVTRLALTVFGLYRVLDFRGKFTISTIVNPWAGSLPEGMIGFIPRFLAMLDFTFPKRFGWRPEPILTRSPSSPKGNPLADLASGTALRGFGPALKGIFGSSLEEPFTAYAKLVKLNSQFASLRRIWEEAYSSTHDPSIMLGKLSLKNEPGKIRVFAMVDIITQWMLHPLHLMLFGILRTIKQDCTFNQDRGVETVRQALASIPEPNQRFVFSYDLSAATDRLPIVLQIALLDAMKEGLGQAWARILVDRDYWLLDKSAGIDKPTPVRYATGQPMGAYSSWAMLALTHHLIIQYAAFSLGYSTWFQKYMVLGDDMVIYDRAVASRYLEVMSTLDVGINLTKSLQSNIGVFEFAKRLVTVTGPIQGVPLALLQGAKYNLSVLIEFLKSLSGNVRLATALRLLGFGYRVMGSSGSFPIKSGRAAFSRLLLAQPGVSTSSTMRWSQWMALSKPNTVETIYAILYRLFRLARVPPETGRIMWHVVMNLPQTMPINGFRNLEMLFESMYNRLSQRSVERYDNYIKTLDSLSAPLSDVDNFIDLLVPLFQDAPIADKLLKDWENLTAWTDYLAEDPVMNLTPSEMMMIKYRESEYSHLSSQWTPPSPTPPVAGETDWDIQILD